MIAAGQLIGNYRIVQKIGTGGMGAVYLAEHPMIGKRIALKVIHRELASNKEVVQRFFQEARAVNTIGNEHIVEIHDFGVTPEGDHFYIMEYLEGKTLASVLARETFLPPMRALHIGAQIANALASAHNAGVVHRDLKPDNIMLMTRLGDPDFVKVLDFGLAKMFQSASAVQTAAGVLLGTPQYMSPEACESKPGLDHRTDIYALGILLFQMMCGQLPFDGETMGEVLIKQVTALPPAPRGLNGAIPPSVEQILLRCLAKQPDARFQTMAALRDALLDPEAYLRASPPIAPARSVAPGEAKVDARTVIAAAEARTRAQVAMPSQAKTLIAGAAPPMVAHGGHPAPPAGPQQSRQIPVPQLQQPNEPKNHTMRIATPMGYSSRPPKKVWPVVVVVGAILGLGGGAFAVAWFGRGSSAPSSGDAGAGSAPPAPGSAMTVTPIDAGGAKPAPPPPLDAAVAVVPPPPPPSDAAVALPVAAKTVKLTIDSSPQGADVFGPDGADLGKTPLSLEWPSSDKPVAFELKLKGYKPHKKELAVDANTITSVDLERVPAKATPKGPGAGSGKGTSGTPGNGLERPD